MSAYLATIVVLAVAMGTALSANQDFEPGCSFYGDKCVYSIKLGHANKCDKLPTTATTSSGSSGGCCDDLSSKYTKLNDDMDALKSKVDVMTKVVSDSSKKMPELEEELKKAKAKRDDIVNVLKRKESELSANKADHAKVLATASKEIQNLRDKLTSVQKSYSTCQAALTGVDPTTVTDGNTGTHSGGDYILTYYNFNKETPDFTFEPVGYYKVKLSLMNTRSGGSTGPSHEHTWGVSEGYYLGLDARHIAEKTSSSQTTTLRAESTRFPPANDYCIMFWYYMEGTDVKTLTTNIKINGGNGYPVFTKTGPSNTNKWELAQISLDSEYTQYQFQIDFTMSTAAYRLTYPRTHYYHSHADIAVDDLYVYNTSCSNIPKHSEGHSFYGNNVTSFYTFHLTPMTWTEAYDVCRREGPWTGLVSIETNAEQLALVNMIRSNPAYQIVGAKGFYTSGSDMDSEHNFAWTNTGVRRSIQQNYWHTGQPNNVAGNQDCLLMEYPNDGFRWGDVNCESKHPFICEVEIPGKVN